MSTKPSSEEAPDLQGAYPRLSDAQIAALDAQGRFLGELSLLTGEGAWCSAVALDAGEVLAVPVGRLRELVARDPALGDLVLRAYLLRRSILIGLGAGLRTVGSKYSPDTRRVRDFAVGDVRAGSAKRVATAVGEGAMAIRLAFERTGPRLGGPR